MRKMRRGSFASQLKGFKENALLETERIRRGVAIRLFSAVILDTPVLTGRLRANWVCSLRNPDTGIVDSADKAGGVTIQSATRTVQSSRKGDDLWLTNNLPYASRIEYDGWSHTKAPKGMVRRNVQRFSRLLQQEARKKRR